MSAVLLAAFFAGMVGAGEQLSRLTPPRQVTMRAGAWRLWLGRFFLDGACAALVVLIAQATNVPNADQPVAGLLAGLATTAAVRSSFIDLGDTPVGLRTAFDPARRYLASRLSVKAAVVTSGDVDKHRMEILRSGVTVERLASRLSAFVRELDTLSSGDSEDELQGIQEQVDDFASDEDVRLKVLLATAHRLGGDELLADLAKSGDLET